MERNGASGAETSGVFFWAPTPSSPSTVDLRGGRHRINDLHPYRFPWPDRAVNTSQHSLTAQGGVNVDHDQKGSTGLNQVAWHDPCALLTLGRRPVNGADRLKAARLRSTFKGC